MWSRTEGEGRDVVFVHGWTMDHRAEMRTYEPIFAVRSGWRRHYIDLPGMGNSPARADIASMDDMLAALLDVIDTLTGGRRFLLAGTSAGGYLARGVVAQLGARIDGVLLRAPLIVAADAGRDVDPVSCLVNDDAVMEAVPTAERAALGTVLVQTPSYVDALRAVIREAVAPANAVADMTFLNAIRQDPARYGFSADVDAEMAPFTCPSLIVAGHHDAVVGHRDVWRLIDKFPRATFVILDRGEHGLPIDQQVLFAALVNDWLDRVEEVTPG